MEEAEAKPYKDELEKAMNACKEVEIKIRK